MKTRTLLPVLLLLIPSGCVSPRLKESERRPIHLRLGLLPATWNGSSEDKEVTDSLISQLRAMRVFDSVGPAASRQSPEFDLVAELDVEAGGLGGIIWKPRMKVYTGEAEDPVFATAIKMSTLKPMGLDAARVMRALVAAFGPDTPAYRRLASAASARKTVPASPAAGEPAVSLPILGPTYKSPASPDDLAVVVGVERYSNLPDARFAERDAAAVVVHLEALGVPRRNIVHLSGGKATLTSLKTYLQAWLPKNAKPSSRVFFYFSGHGSPDIETGDAYLLPWDGDPAFISRTGYPLKSLYADLNKLPVAKVLVALDACFSGAGGRSVLAKGARPLVTRVDLGQSAANDVTVLTAASADEITTTVENKGHGIFTYYLLQGLNGAAKDGSGRITSRGLYDYLKPKVQDEARLQNREQTPTFRADGDLVLR